MDAIPVIATSASARLVPDSARRTAAVVASDRSIGGGAERVAIAEHREPRRTAVGGDELPRGGDETLVVEGSRWQVEAAERRVAGRRGPRQQER